MLWLLLTAVLGTYHVDRADVEMLELNHQRSADGCLQFDQVIVWKWAPDYRRWNAHHWFIVSSPPGYPVQAGEFYQCYGCYSDQKRILFRAKIYRETWTTNDPERENLKLFPLELRTR